MSAVEYNVGQHLDVEVIKRIQRTVGATADGKWGKRTCAQIKAWQQAQGVSADGKVGPGTLARFEKLWAADNKPCDDEHLDDVTDGGAPLDDGHDDHVDSCETVELGEGFAYFDGNTDLDAKSSGDDVIALFNDLFAFGCYDDAPIRVCGKAGTAAITAFQQAALTPHRIDIHAHQRVEVPVTFKLGKQGTVDANTRAEIRRWKDQGYRYQKPGLDFVERRVRVNLLGTLPRSSANLTEVPSTGDNPRLLHKLAAAALRDMIAACKQDTGVELLVQSGWRRHRWTSRKQYEDTVVKKYGSVREGSKWLAYSSPHETGLAVDFGTGGLECNSKTCDKQRQTPVYKWLAANAYRFGFHPYKREPWHWEFPLSLRAWTTGQSDWRVVDDVDVD